MTSPESTPVPDEPAVAKTRKPLRKRVSVWAIGLLAALAAFIAALPFLLSTGWVGDVISDWLRENIDTPVEFETLDVSWTQGVRIEKLTVRDATPQHRPLLEAPVVEIDAPMLPLLRRKLLVSKFVLHEPVIYIARTDEGEVNTAGVVRKRKLRRKRRGEREQPGVEEPEEELVLPEVRVPVVVHDATLVFRAEDGREARQSGVQFSGDVTTRDGPTKFRFEAPDRPGHGLVAEGEVTLFGPYGLLLPGKERRVDLTLTLDRIDAAPHRDLLALFLDDRASGVLDGKISIRSHGNDAEGTIDLTLSGLAVGEGVATQPRDEENLRISGAFRRTGDSVSLRDFEVAADGLSIAANLDGSYDALRGTAHVQADFERGATALRALGIDVPREVAGRLDGGIEFAGDGQGGDGRFLLTGFSAPSPIEGRPPVTVDHADLSFRLVPGDAGLRLERSQLRVHELTATATGELARDGSFDARAETHGDVGALIAKIRDLGMLPRDLALNGRLDGVLRASREPQGETAFEVERLTLTDDGVSIRVSGTRSGAGVVDLVAEGSGDVGRLFAEGASATGSVAREVVQGQFDFRAVAKGPRDALEVTLDRLIVKGPLVLEANGAMAADGTLNGRLRVDGQVSEAVMLARRMGLIEGPLPLHGRILAAADVSGTRDAPVVPNASLRVEQGPVYVNAEGSVTAAGELSGNLTMRSELDRLVELARAAGHLRREAKPGGTMVLRAEVSGTREGVQVPSAVLTLEGPVQGRVTGSLDADQRFTADGDVRGALAALAQLESAWTGEEARKLDGSFEARWTAAGSGSEFSVDAPRFQIRSYGLSAQGDAKRSARGDVEGHLRFAGPMADLVRLARDAGYAEMIDETEIDATGRLDGNLDATLTGDRVVAGASVEVGDLTLSRRSGGVATFNEKRLSVKMPSLQYDTATRRLEPTRVTADFLTSDLHADIGVDANRIDTALDVDATFRGDLGPAARLASVWSGEEPPRIEGTFEGRVRASGPRGDLAIDVPKLEIRSGTLTADVTGERAADRSTGRAVVKGAIGDLLGLARAAGFATDKRATGTLDAIIEGHVEKGVGEAKLRATALDVEYTQPGVNDAPFREPRIEITADKMRFHVADRRVEPFDVKLAMAGATLAGRVSADAGDATTKGGEDPRPLHVTASGTLRIAAEFAKNHPELFPDTTLESVEGPFTFAGDVSRGREGAATWTGGFDVVAAGVTAPYVQVERATVVGKFESGTLVLDPVQGRVNGGDVNAKARIGLVGKPPLHALEVHGKNVMLDAELAPLIARASPLFASGEAGRTGGRADVDMTLTAKGQESERIKRTAEGEGVLVLQDAYVESTNFVGKILGMVGAGPRLSVANARVPFKVKNGKVTTAELPVDAAGMLMKLGGEVGLNGDLDYLFKIKPTTDGGGFSKYAKLLDKDGYLPLRLGGDVGSPDVKLPSAKDLLGGGIGDLWDKLRGKDEDDEDEKKKKAEEEEEAERRREERRRRKKAEREKEAAAGDAPPEDGADEPSSDPDDEQKKRKKRRKKKDD